MRFTLLHTNDIHGRIEGLARVATLVERVREETSHRVIYVDAGDVEEATTRLSNLTKGVAMHRLLSAAGCEVAVVGNATWLRYGPQVIAEQARAASYPLLLANLAPVEGVQATALVDGRACVPPAAEVKVRAEAVPAGFRSVMTSLWATVRGFPPVRPYALFLTRLDPRDACRGSEDARAAVVPADAEARRNVGQNFLDDARPTRLKGLLRLDDDPVSHPRVHGPTSCDSISSTRD